MRANGMNVLDQVGLGFLGAETQPAASEPSSWLRRVAEMAVACAAAGLVVKVVTSKVKTKSNPKKSRGGPNQSASQSARRVREENLRAEGIPCYCSSITSGWCDFCSGLAPIDGERARDTREWLAKVKTKSNPRRGAARKNSVLPQVDRDEISRMSREELLSALAPLGLGRSFDRLSTSQLRNAVVNVTIDNLKTNSNPESHSFIDRIITVWEVKSVDGKQVELVMHPAYPDDYSYQHEYQRIIYRGPHSQWDGAGKKPAKKIKRHNTNCGCGGCCT